MSTVAAPGEDARPALALVNTRRNDHGVPVDDLADTTAVRAWLARQGFARAHVDDAALAAMHELRHAIRELLEARIDGRP